MNKNALLPVVALVLFGLVFGASMVGVSHRLDRTGEFPNFSGSDDGSTYDKVYAVSAGGRLVLDSDVGEVIVRGSDRTDTKIHVSVRGTEKQIKRFSVSSSQDGSVVTVKGIMDREYLHWFGNESPDVRFEIDVPREFNLRLSTAGGNIVLSDVKGEVNGETSGGDLECTQIDGTVRMSTSGGNVRVRQASGDYHLETSGGNINCEDLSGPFYCETSGGNIDLRNLDGKVYASTSGGNITAALKDNKGVELSTSGGNVSVRLPKTIAADVNAEASGGDVSCSFPFSGTMREGELHGKINGGGNSIRLETSGGDIVLSELD